MNKLVSLLEDAGVQTMLQENSVLVESAMNDLTIWYGYLNNYISENIEEFLESNLEETMKSIYTFSTFSTKQFLCEMSQYYGNQMWQSQVLKEAARTEFC